LAQGDTVSVKATDGVRYALPQKIAKGEDGKVDVYFRVGDVYTKKRIVVECDGKEIYSRKTLILAPGEMEKVTLTRADITGDVTVRLV
jgi:hypothetical protein